MKWASALSIDPSLEAALDAVTDALRHDLGTLEPDLLIAFATEHHRPDYNRLVERLSREFDGATLVGCSAGGVIGAGREVEGEAALSVTAAFLPGVRVSPLRLEMAHLPPDDAPRAVWEDIVRAEGPEPPHFLLLPDPFTFDPVPLMATLDRNFPGSTVIGGMASGGRFPGGNALFLDKAVHYGGLVGVSLSGNLAVDTVVAQGCRPIGFPMFVTACQGGLLRGLDGRKPTDILAELYQSADEHDRALFRHSLFLGVVMREHKETYGRGDFLIRNLVGVEPKAGLLQVAAALYPGQVVQFHLRDSMTSAEDVALLLEQYREAHPGRKPAGAMLFSCLGRGAGLYGEPDHDTRVYQQVLGDGPVGGFFCNGEIGPVQGTTFLHGYTSSFALFRGRSMH